MSDNPAFTEMRVALQEYETSTHYSSPTKHRAFFSALRTLLSEIVTEHNSSEQAIKLSAAYKWFSKHKPHTTDDPALAAALAASLSISAAEGPQRQARPSDDINKARAFTTQGTKHEFFSPYSAAPTQQQQQQQQPHRVTGPGAARAAAAPPPPALPRPTPKLRPDIVLAPSVRSGGPRQESTHPPQGSLSSLGPVLAPKGRKARAVFDPDNLEAPAGQHPNTQVWLGGPASRCSCRVQEGRIGGGLLLLVIGAAGMMMPMLSFLTLPCMHSSSVRASQTHHLACVRPVAVNEHDLPPSHILHHNRDSAACPDPPVMLTCCT